MSISHLGVIGAGAIVGELLSTLARILPEPIDRLSILVRPGREEPVHARLGPAAEQVAHLVTYLRDADSLAATHPDLVIEAAGHGAVAAHVAPLLRHGIETVIASTGALADEALETELTVAARRGGTRLVVPAGAVGAADVLSALSLAGPLEVDYTGRKPPEAWRATPADDAIDLAALTESTVIFEGSARQAARDYPKNANVAATIAMVGAGFEATRVRLVADPGVCGNVHEISVTSPVARLQFSIEGTPSPDNPKTSLTTVLSLAREVMRRVGPVVG